MTKHIRAKLVLELRANGLSRKEIARTRGMSMQTVMKVFDAADKYSVRWEDVKEKGDDEVFGPCFPKGRQQSAP